MAADTASAWPWLREPATFYTRADVPWQPTDDQLEVLKRDMVRMVEREHGEPGWAAAVRSFDVEQSKPGTWTVSATIVLEKCGACSGL